MALTKDLTKFGVTFKNAYTRISSTKYATELKKEVVHNELDMTDPNNPVVVPPTITWINTKLVEVNYSTYSNSQSFTNREDSISHGTVSFLIEPGTTSIDILTISYNHLKTLPEFTGAANA